MGAGTPAIIVMAVAISLIVTILENLNGFLKTDKELIVFRDSFASSLTPLLLEQYSNITLIDLRYISASKLNDVVDFKKGDVLFLYSTMIINQSVMLKD